MEEKTMTRKNATYPLPESAPSKLIWALAISPLFLMFAVATVTYSRNSLSTFIFKEANATAYYALIMALATLASTILSPIAGKLGDLYGRKRMTIVLTVPLILSVIGASTARSALPLGIAYFVMGMVMNTIVALANGMMIDMFSPSTRTKLLSFGNSADALAGMGGPILAGLMANKVGAQNAFLTTTVFLGIAFILLLVFIPDIRTIKKNVVVDIPGIISLVLFIGPLCTVLSLGGKQLAWNSPITYALYVCTVIFFVVFIKVEKKSKQPTVYLPFFKSKGYIIVTLLTFLSGIVMAIIPFYNLYAMNVMKYNAAQIGTLSLLVWIPIVLNPIIGVYLAKTGKYKLIFIISSCALILTCFSYYFVLTPTTPVWVAMLSNLPRFINNCTFMAPILAYLSHILPEDKRGMGLGIAAFLQTLMGSVFTAVFGAVVNAYNGNLAVAFKTIMIITFVIAVARLVFAIALKDHKVVYDEIAALENNK